VKKNHAEHDISSLNGLIIFLIWLDKEVCNHLSNQNNAVLHLAAHQSTGFTPSPDCHRTPLRFRRRHHRTRCNAATLLDPSSLLDPIVQHPATKALSVDVRPRSRLKRSHRHLFTSSNSNTTTTTTKLSLFDELGLVACTTGVVCRKEFLETYAAAACIHAKFSLSSNVGNTSKLNRSQTAVNTA